MYDRLESDSLHVFVNSAGDFLLTIRGALFIPSWQGSNIHHRPVQLTPSGDVIQPTAWTDQPMYDGIGMARAITPSVFLPFELAVVLNDYAAITIDDQTNKERSH